MICLNVSVSRQEVGEKKEILRQTGNRLRKRETVSQTDSKTNREEPKWKANEKDKWKAELENWILKLQPGGTVKKRLVKGTVLDSITRLIFSPHHFWWAAPPMCPHSSLPFQFPPPHTHSQLPITCTDWYSIRMPTGRSSDTVSVTRKSQLHQKRQAMSSSPRGWNKDHGI